MDQEKLNDQTQVGHQKNSKQGQKTFQIAATDRGGDQGQDRIRSETDHDLSGLG